MSRFLSLLAPDEIKASRRFNLGPAIAVSISSNAITITDSRHALIATSGATNRRLKTINGGTDGDIVVLQQHPTSTEIASIIDDEGNLRLAGNFDLDSPNDRLVLLFDGVNWCELSRSNN